MANEKIMKQMEWHKVRNDLLTELEGKPIRRERAQRVCVRKGTDGGVDEVCDYLRWTQGNHIVGPGLPLCLKNSTNGTLNPVGEAVAETRRKAGVPSGKRNYCEGPYGEFLPIDKNSESN